MQNEITWYLLEYKNATRNEMVIADDLTNDHYNIIINTFDMFAHNCLFKVIKQHGQIHKDELNLINTFNLKRQTIAYANTRRFEKQPNAEIKTYLNAYTNELVFQTSKIESNTRVASENNLNEINEIAKNYKCFINKDKKYDTSTNIVDMLTTENMYNYIKDGILPPCLELVNDQLVPATIDNKTMLFEQFMYYISLRPLDTTITTLDEIKDKYDCITPIYKSYEKMIDTVDYLPNKDNMGFLTFDQASLMILRYNIKTYDIQPILRFYNETNCLP